VLQHALYTLNVEMKVWYHYNRLRLSYLNIWETFKLFH